MGIYIGILEILLVIFILFIFYINKKVQKSQIKKIFIIDLIILFWICLFLVIQYWGNYYFKIPLIYFESYIYIGTCFLPITIFFTGLIFTNTKIKFRKRYLLFSIIPILSLIVLWTNNFHHLFYISYSINLNETIFGPYITVHSLYSYAFLALSIFLLIKYSIKNAGFFSKQSLLFVLGSALPVVVNILGTFNIIPMTIYLTPISFAFAIFCYAIAIFKFKFLSMTPIAMQRIVDRMSDSFFVVNDNNLVTDFNDTLLRNFKLRASDIRNKNFMNFIKSNKVILSEKEIIKVLNKSKTSTEIIMFKKELKVLDKYFNVEISGIRSNNNYLGTLILLKDVTQHVIDKQIIENNQNMLMEKERLASLGQMIGGIAHNLKTPIMSIAGAAEGLTDLTKEYDISIGDPSVTNEDHHAIVQDMNSWIEKVKTHTSYMSDVITAVKGQAVAFSETTNDGFTISELLTHVDVLMKHELKNALIELNTSVLVPENISIKGNINSLVQVINNIISNAIQSYNGQTNKNIDFIIKKKDNNIVFTIQDYGCGIPKKIQDKLFKEMITTKGKNGTGLGLFMSFSNIRAHFNGTMTFESAEEKGTKFDICIPLN